MGNRNGDIGIYLHSLERQYYDQKLPPDLTACQRLLEIQVDDWLQKHAASLSDPHPAKKMKHVGRSSKEPTRSEKVKMALSHPVVDGANRNIAERTYSTIDMSNNFSCNDGINMSTTSKITPSTKAKATNRATDRSSLTKSRKAPPTPPTLPWKDFKKRFSDLNDYCRYLSENSDQKFFKVVNDTFKGYKVFVLARDPKWSYVSQGARSIIEKILQGSGTIHSELDLEVNGTTHIVIIPKAEFNATVIFGDAAAALKMKAKDLNRLLRLNRNIYCFGSDWVRLKFQDSNEISEEWMDLRPKGWNPAMISNISLSNGNDRSNVNIPRKDSIAVNDNSSSLSD